MKDSSLLLGFHPQNIPPSCVVCPDCVLLVMYTLFASGPLRGGSFCTYSTTIQTAYRRSTLPKATRRPSCPYRGRVRRISPQRLSGTKPDRDPACESLLEGPDGVFPPLLRLKVIHAISTLLKGAAAKLAAMVWPGNVYILLYDTELFCFLICYQLPGSRPSLCRIDLSTELAHSCLSLHRMRLTGGLPRRRRGHTLGTRSVAGHR